ncbi:fibrobacter succinogenes major paralogous domain-containing protein [Dysgonomonas termitidis]|uniref:Fibrobacter succinogenes major paralogous domain-containing protein n=1 Tax=Dysgonomonas termitidis TaxID=1516126 RepID=A0ABV9KV69_9BACT
MERKTLKLLVIGALSLMTLQLQSQVTIGSGLEPRRAALLDLKTRQGAAGTVSSVSDDANITSGLGDGGLLLPRVKLVSISTLEPFIPTSDPDFTANTDNLKERLAGLMVYNITNNGVGSTLYPAVYTWNGAIWVTSQANEAVSSITGQPQQFTFYELGTETAAPLTFTVDGLGTWTYQWYQVTGNNVHVLIGTPIGGSGTISGIGATTTSFTPAGALKGTTRNANNTGFYKFYCIATSTLGAELTSDIAEVAVGCGAKNNAGEWISFMCFNLGATDLTIAAQRNHPMTNILNDSDGRHYYIAGEENLYGDLYQWGRIGDGHQKRGAAQGFTVGANTAGTNQVAYGSGPTYEDGNLIGPTTRYPWRQVARTDATHYGMFIYGTGSGQNYNWAYNLLANQIDQLWRTGRFAPNDPCAKIKEDGLTYESYYPAQSNNINDGSADTSWRTPSQDEWGNLYKGGTVSGFSSTATANTWVWYNTNGRGYEIRPDGATTTLFLPANGTRSYGSGSLYGQGVNGYYWSINIISTDAYGLHFNSGSVYPAYSIYRAEGIALRCIKNS